MKVEYFFCVVSRHTLVSVFGQRTNGADACRHIPFSIELSGDEELLKDNIIKAHQRDSTV